MVRAGGIDGIIFDLNLTNFEQNSALVKQIIDKGQKPKIIYVLRDPDTAFEGIVSRAMDKESEDFGRIVTVNQHIEIHKKVRETFFKLIDKFGDDVKYKIYDNRGDLKDVKTISLEKLREISYNYDEIKERLYEENEESKELPESLKRNLTRTKPETSGQPQKPQTIPESGKFQEELDQIREGKLIYERRAGFASQPSSGMPARVTKDLETRNEPQQDIRSGGISKPNQSITQGEGDVKGGKNYS